MEDAGPPSGGASLTLSDVDFDLVDELLFESCWWETTQETKFFGSSETTPASPFVSSCFSPTFDIAANNIFQSSTLNKIEIDQEVIAFPRQNENNENSCVNMNENNENSCVNMNESEANHERWWTQSRLDSGPSISVKERLVQALRYIKESNRDSDVLVQLWMPVSRGGRHVLTTHGQPFSLNPCCERLVNYRTVSVGYYFSAEEGSDEALGLPGRVFVGKVPEWTPDVQYFSSYEYPRVNHAQMCDVRGTLALPFFEGGSKSCLGVVEVVMTTQKINYRDDLENICNALQAVNLRSSEVPTIHYIKEHDSYQAALPEIIEVVRSACKMHKLPLAQTWIPCIQQGKLGTRHSDENYKVCVSTLDIACNVTDPAIWGFHEACSEHHLFKGQGVVGKAFKTNQPCFSADITEFSKIEYPLAHYARMFGLRAAVAIRLQSIHTGTVDYVLEFFLPTDCSGSEEQRVMLNSLSVTVQQICQSLRVVSAKELEDDEILQTNELVSSSGSSAKYYNDPVRRSKEDDQRVGASPSVGPSGVDISWITNAKKDSNLEFKKKGTEGLGVLSPLTQREPPEVMLPVGGIFSESQKHNQDLPNNTSNHGDSFIGDSSLQNAREGREKRRTKTEKTVNLQVLRQYFARSLKDAAKSIGVCPTTLKRICRQHGITSWPSRKIKKVDHSLKKLQLVIDSVKGAHGAFQISSIYDNFPKASATDLVPNNSGTDTLTPPKQIDHPGFSKVKPDGVFNTYSFSSNSQSSSCSQSSSSSPCSSGSKPCFHPNHVAFGADSSTVLNHTSSLKRALSELKLHVYQEAPEHIGRSHSHKSFDEKPFLSKPTMIVHDHNSLRVKVTYGEEKVRFRVQSGWGFGDIKQEIVKRFNIDDVGLVNLKYLDDDEEWVLLTCDDDLHECTDIYRTCGARAINLSVHRVSSEQWKFFGKQ